MDYYYINHDEIELRKELFKIIKKIEETEQKENFFVTIPSFSWDRIKHIVYLLNKSNQ